MDEIKLGEYTLGGRKIELNKLKETFGEKKEDLAGSGVDWQQKIVELGILAGLNIKDVDKEPREEYGRWVKKRRSETTKRARDDG